MGHLGEGAKEATARRKVWTAQEERSRQEAEAFFSAYIWGWGRALASRVGHRAKNQKVNILQTIFSTSNKYKALPRNSFSVSGHIFCENAILMFSLKTALK
jgi:hypothetical protein